MKRAIAATVLLGALGLSRQSAAMECSFSAVLGVSFGGYDVFDTAPLDSTGSITYQCSLVQPTDMLVIDLSKGSSSSYAPRTLVQGIYELAYNIYLDAARTVIWGDGSGSTSHYGPVVPAEGSATLVRMYGRIPALQTGAAAGSYGDTVVATMLF